MNDDVIEEIDQQQQPQQQPAAAVDAAAFTAARKTTRLKLITFLERYDEFPLPTRNDMDEWAEDCLTSAENNVHSMLCDNRYGDVYRGLDSSRDTEDEVEAIVRFFPDTVGRRIDDGDHHIFLDHLREMYPIQFLTKMFTNTGVLHSNLKAVSFVQLLARLAIEFGSFQDHERGGLLCGGISGLNTLQCLTKSFSAMIYGKEHNQLVDDAYLTQLIRLRHTGLLKIEDIQDHRLVRQVHNYHYFPERRFRFLTEWYPLSLLQTDANGWVPLHAAAYYSTIQSFRCAFELGILYYPNKKGISLLFTKGNDDDTPFQLACSRYGRDEVMKIVEETLLLSSQQQQQEQRVAGDDGNNNTNSVGLYNIIDTFVMVAMDENIHFDCVYFLLRRQPDLLKRLISGSMTNNDDVANGSGGSDSGSGSGSGSGSDIHNDSDHDEIDNGNFRHDDIDAHLNCKKEDNNNRNDKDNYVENHVDGKNNKNDDGNNKNDDDNEMLIIDANANSISNANAEANSNTNENNRKRRENSNTLDSIRLLLRQRKEERDKHRV